MDRVNLTPEELGARWGYAKQTLANLRSLGTGPQFIKFGRRVLYPLDAVEAFERDHRMSANSVRA